MKHLLGHLKLFMCPVRSCERSQIGFADKNIRATHTKRQHDLDYKEEDGSLYLVDSSGNWRQLID
jgi:hypothetical protein